MSSVVGILYDNLVKIGADTYAHQPFQQGDVFARHHNFSSKVFHLPHLRSVFGNTGTQLLGNLLYEFIQARLVGKDINCLLNLDLATFDDFVKAREVPGIYGHIYAYGFFFISGKFRGACLYYSPEEPDRDWHHLTSSSHTNNSRYVVNPSVKNLFDKLEKDYEDGASTADNFIVATIRKQRQEDLAKELSAQVGIGEEIILTTFGHSDGGKFTIVSEIVYEFPDKDHLGK